jgi:hypothetical protein
MPNITRSPATGGQTPRAKPAPAARPATGSHAALVALRSLTDRDRYLLAVLAEHQVLTADQIARLKYTDANTARKRLVLLTRRGILDRFRDGVRPGSQAWRYTLGPLGATIVAAAQARPAPRSGAHTERVLRLARSPRLAHLLGVNEFFVALAAHARAHPGYALRLWWNEARATAACAGLAHPDGLGVWAYRPPDPGGSRHGDSHLGSRELGRVGREVVFFVEHDEGSEPIPRVTGKLAGYAQARLGGGPDHPVLFWLPTLAREAHLHAHLARHRLPSPAPVVATATRQHADATRLGPAGPVWLPLGHATRRTLIDLAPHTATHAPADDLAVADPDPTGITPPDTDGFDIDQAGWPDGSAA